MFKKALTVLTSALVISSSLSFEVKAIDNSFEPPTSCSYGRDRTSWTLGETRVEFDFRYNESDEQEQDREAEEKEELLRKIVKILEVSIDSLDYIRIESPNYVLQGREFRAKGNLFDRFAYTRFHNSEEGYVGKDKSNWDGNSYLNMKFTDTHGLGVVWITRGDQSECSMEPVYVQKVPTIRTASADAGYGRIDVDLSYFVDHYSKASIESNTDVRIMVTTRSDGFGTTESKSFDFSQLDGNASVSVYPSTGGGPYSVRVQVFDGTYAKSEQLGSVFVPGKSTPPCPNCNLL
ncbi:hypothetical protein [Colwellia sp. MB02u-14]|uniref:hypothetical protein n=1 Tax=Colwellia sp. MB02u-14 TaxID=2759815 RepID=UPI0015F47308|nr:hypothetical protein [Colwellia sp. MB02u-14]MBA6303318.1 hypothetical protein [Colwellia sp. MB02u-14]